MFAFELGREFKLSIAEIFSIFPLGKIVFCDNKILILDNILKEEIFLKAKKIGGTIKIIEITDTGKDIKNILYKNINIKNNDGKYNYAINIFGISKIGHKEILEFSKKIIKEYGKNPRFINKKFENVHSITIIKEALIKKQTDFNFIFTSEKTYFGHTIFVQNIYGYSNRDFGKNKDMNTGILPPKLAQIMINIATQYHTENVIYDPFVGCGTILIESIYMGNKKVYGSDLNKKMIEISKQNLQNLKRDFLFDYNIVLQNSKYIHEIKFLDEIDVIVTEGYLGEIITKNNISIERIEKQKIKLVDIYEGFFLGLKKLNFKGNIVISFPFWEINGKYIYFNKIYDILNKYCEIKKLLPKNIEFKETKSGSLLYKRDSQLVGREIFNLKLKNK